MDETLKKFHDLILENLGVLEADLARQKEKMIDEKGALHEDGYVFRENIGIFGEEILAIGQTRRILDERSLASFGGASEYAEFVVHEIDRLSQKVVLLRSGLLMIRKLIEKICMDCLPDLKLL